MDVENNEAAETSLRDDLAAAFDGVASGDGENQAARPDGDAGAVEAAVGSAVEGGRGDVSGPGDAGTTDGTNPPASNGARARDASGKFVKGATTKTEAPKQGATSQAAPPVADRPNGTAPPAQGTTASTKAPQSWKAAEREHWGAIPPAAQEAIIRREREIAAGLQSSAPDRQFRQGWEPMLQQYAPLFGGADPRQGVQSLLQTANTLAYGPAPQKAQVVAHLIKSYGVDIQQLDSLLAGQPAAQSATPAPSLDPNQIAAQVRQQLSQEFQQQRAVSALTRADAELASFSDGKEFLDDVQDAMADLMEVAARRGVPLSFEDAYNRALKLDPDISKILEQREKAAKASNAQASMARARVAASSVRSTPTGVVQSAQPDTLRGALEAAFDSTSGR